MTSPLIPIEAEAKLMLEFFTEAADGQAVMDGEGKIWHKHGCMWSWASANGRRRMAVPSSMFARALCPDLAEYMPVAS